MGTRSAIAIREKNGTFTAIYCHYDGCPVLGHGKTLLQFYNTEVDVNNLIAIDKGIKSLKTSIFETKKDVFPEIPAALLKDEESLRYWAFTQEDVDYIYIWDNGWRFIERDHGAGEMDRLVDLRYYIDEYTNQKAFI